MVLLKAAQFMREHRYEIAAWEVFEVAKSWKEADADVVEAIDFCEYYAREAFAMGKGKALLRVPGEDNTYTYRAKGVGVVISPWNFPLAIPMGMTAASIVTGNPTILKPAGQSVIMGEWVYRALREGGCPADVIHYLPGSGSELGPILTQSPTTAFIVFTGSMEVGTQIIEEAAKRIPGARLVKKVVAEMGGKNALIVDEDADLDEAVTGCLYSAYGFQGQKCSALSRLIVHEAIYDRFMDRFREAMKDIRLGEATDAGVFLSAVVDKGAFQKISAIIEETRKIAARTTQGAMPTNVSREGYYIPPTLFEGVMPDARAAKEEIFGPVVVAFKVKSLEEGVKLANSGLFALTGGLFSRSPAAIAYVRENLEAGNIYINRGITGAIVHRHPFGGYKLSGVGSKAGGPDYLYQFVDPVTVVENTMRRGFAPEIES
jgi:RHH-type proline utilization regulon transcriptional repressor/proline dehydrogenase/delta 1-pyrroline-5-carboxylate dehydrogenase